MATLDEKIVLQLPPETVRILSQFSGRIQNFGIEITANTTEKIEVSRVPECFVQPDTTTDRQTLLNLVTKLALELADRMVETRGGFALLPKTIGDLLNSKARRGFRFFFLFEHLSESY